MVARIENHLRDTHKIKDEDEYRKLLKGAFAVIDVNQTEDETESDSDSDSDCQNRLEEHKSFKKIKHSYDTKRYLENWKGLPINSDDSSDEDWLELCVRNSEKKEGSKYFQEVSWPEDKFVRNPAMHRYKHLCNLMNIYEIKIPSKISFFLFKL